MHTPIVPLRKKDQDLLSGRRVGSSTPFCNVQNIRTIARLQLKISFFFDLKEKKNLFESQN